MGTQYGPTTENFFDFFKKYPLTLVMGSEIIESAHVFLNFFNFSFLQTESFPSTSFMGTRKEHFGEN